MSIALRAGVSAQMIPYRLRIGVSGHRHLTESESLNQQVQSVLDRVLSRFPARASTPIVLTAVSSLAEGADRLLATEVLARENATLDAIIPLMPDDYLADFSSEDSRQEFRRLLALDPEPVFLRATPLRDDFPPDVIPHVRPRAYREAGECVARQCDVLIAIWDGENAKGEGGTGDIVAFARENGTPVFVIDPRSPHAVTEYWGDGLDLRGYLAVDEYNAAVDTEPCGMALEKEFIAAFESGNSAALPKRNLEIVQAVLLPKYLRASALSRRNQCRYFRIGMAVYSLAGLAVLLVTAAALLPRLAVPLFAGEAFSLLLIVILVALARRGDYHRKWVSYRFLSERLRAACVLGAIGYSRPPVLPGAGKNVPRDQDDWTFRAFTAIMDRIPRHDLITDIDPAAQRAFVKRTWLDAQTRYHRQRASLNRRKSVSLDVAADIVFYAAMGCALLHLAISLVRPHAEGGGLPQLLGLLALSLPALGAALIGIRKHREYERLVSRSRSMELQLRDVAHQLNFADTPERMRRAIRSLDELVLAESQDWRVQVRFLIPSKPA